MLSSATFTFRKVKVFEIKNFLFDRLLKSHRVETGGVLTLNEMKEETTYAFLENQ